MHKRQMIELYGGPQNSEEEHSIKRAHHLAHPAACDPAYPVLLW